MRVDLHIHSHASDGVHAPDEVMRLAAGAGLSTVALTDHDTVDGVARAARAARQLGLDFVPGVELSATHDEREIHVLGYWIDFKDPHLLDTLEALRTERVERIEGMVSRLADAGLPITKEAVFGRATGVASRVHIGRELVATGVARDWDDAFLTYLDEGTPFHIPRVRRTLRQTVELIESVGGVASIAHPARSGVSHLVPEFAASGIRAVEAFHRDQSPAETASLVAAAHASHLLVSGGSDYHGVRPLHETIGGVDYPVEHAAPFLALGKE